MGGIRNIERHELTMLLPGARMFRSEANLPGNFNAESFIGTLVELIDGGNWFCMIAEGDGGDIEGAIAGLVHPDPMSGDRVCMEMFWFVRPEHRQGKTGLQLLDAWENEARARECKRMIMVRIVGLNDEALDKLYVRRGYKEFERSYIKDT